MKMIPHLYRKQPQILLSKMGEKFGVWSFKMCNKIKRITGLLTKHCKNSPILFRGWDELPAFDF
ncbi:hypothetical protein DW974_13690 [Lachnospiraceae bacterium AM48-27BH]|nr:hypothetical protein DW974_13690 [Lachnospiraceae bacterium AM48-27BH]